MFLCSFVPKGAVPLRRAGHAPPPPAPPAPPARTPCMLGTVGDTGFSPPGSNFKLDCFKLDCLRCSVFGVPCDNCIFHPLRPTRWYVRSFSFSFYYYFNLLFLFTSSGTITVLGIGAVANGTLPHPLPWTPPSMTHHTHDSPSTVDTPLPSF